MVVLILMVVRNAGDGGDVRGAGSGGGGGGCGWR